MTVMKKIYMAGVGGMLGKAFHDEFAADYQLKCSDIDVNEPWLSRMDFRDRDAYWKDVSAFAPDYLFHIGAHTDLEYCETNPDDTYLTNTLAVENAVNIANTLDIPLLYIGTAGTSMAEKKSTTTGIPQTRYATMHAANLLARCLFVKIAGDT